MMRHLRTRTAPAALVAALALSLPACGADDGADVRELEGEGGTTGSETGTHADTGSETGTDADTGGETGTDADTGSETGTDAETGTEG